MIEYFRKMTLGAKLVLCYIALILLPMVLMGSYFYRQIERSSLQQSQLVMQSSLAQLRLNVLHKAHLIENSALIFASSANTRAVFGNSSWDSDEMLQAYQFELSPFARILLAQNSEIQAMHLYLKDSMITELHHSYFSTRSTLQPALYLERTAQKPSADGWQMPKPGLFGDRIGDISYALGVTSQSSSLQTALLEIEVAESYLFDGLQDKSLLQLGEMYIVDAQGDVITVGGDRLWLDIFAEHSRPTTGTYAAKLGTALVLVEPLEALNASIVGVFPIRNLTQDVSQKAPALIAALSLLLALLSCIFYWTTRFLLSRLRQLHAAMDTVRHGDFSMRVDVTVHDEIGALAETFNLMTARIEELLETNYKITLMEKDAEFRALEAQINPHFLYNTLATISWAARAKHDETLASLSDALAKFYRLVLSKGVSLIPVADELAMVKAYMHIQKTRFEDRFDIVYRVDPDCLSLYMIKNILQPLVENALEHGIHPKRSHGNIFLDIHRTGDALCLSVADDGVGMQGDQLEMLNLGNAKSKYGSGYAVKSIIERLRTFYGDEQSFFAESAPGGGTIVSMTLPIREMRS